MLTAACIILGVVAISQTLRLNRLQASLDQVRCATYELTSMQEDTVKDLQDTVRRMLAEPGRQIPMVTTRRDERARRLMLSPDERHAESLAQFEEVCKKAEEMWKRPDDREH